MVRRRGRRRKKLLDELKDRRGYSHLKEEAPGKFRNVVLEKDGEDQLDRSCEKRRSVTYRVNEHPTGNKKTEG